MSLPSCSLFNAFNWFVMAADWQHLYVQALLFTGCYIRRINLKRTCTFLVRACRVGFTWFVKLCTLQRENNGSELFDTDVKVPYLITLVQSGRTWPYHLWVHTPLLLLYIHILFDNAVEVVHCVGVGAIDLALIHQLCRCFKVSAVKEVMFLVDQTVAHKVVHQRQYYSHHSRVLVLTFCINFTGVCHFCLLAVVLNTKHCHWPIV